MSKGGSENRYKRDRSQSIRIESELAFNKTHVLDRTNKKEGLLKTERPRKKDF